MNKIYPFLLLFFLFSCSNRTSNNFDTGDSQIEKNGTFWPNKINTSISPGEKGELFNIVFHNVSNEFETPYGQFSIRNIPYSEKPIPVFKYDVNNIEQVNSRYNNSFPGESTSLGAWDLWEEYPDLLFEITHISNNERNIEGFLNLAYLPTNDNIPFRNGEADTLFFKGTFEARLPK